MANTYIEYTGDNSTTNYTFPFEYFEQSEVKATIDGTATTDFTFANATTLSFNTAPGTGAKIRIYRETDVTTLKATFFPGSAVKAEDLNDNFTQNNFAVEEIRESTWDIDTETIKSNETWVSSDSQIATTAAMDQRFQDEATETIESTETWVSDNDRVPTTAAADARSTVLINAAVTTAISVDGTGLTVDQSSGNSAEFGIGAGSVDLDRINPANIITSAEANPNDDNTIATTAKIDDMIDAAITGDIAVDSTGLTLTDDGDGTITMGIGAGSVDLDRIKDDDIITYAEQDAGSPAPADTNIFTASAAARRFDTLVQLATPTGSNWEVGKTWLQNDDDLTVSIWNGSAWTAVSSGGTFREQPKVIYVDASGGDDNNTGHRISAPKLTIKEAIKDINEDIDTSIKTAGSGYADGSYSNVALTGGTGSGLRANITVSGGAITACTVTSTTTLQDYGIGNILSAADSDLGSGGGSGFELEVTGNGDGMIVVVAAGVYQEIAPIQIKRRNVSIIGQALRSCIVHPTVATETNNLFELNSGSYLSSMTFTGVKAGTGTGNTLDPDLPTTQGWNAAFYNDAYIVKSPYIQNCTNFSDSEIDNSDLNAHNPAGGSAGDTDSAPTGGGLLINGATPHDSSPLRSMVCDSYTHVGLNGPGILVTNNGYAQCTSSYAFFNKYHIKCLNGGQANLAASTTDFGDKALVADGKSSSAIFTSNVDGAAADLDTTFNINAPTAAAGWHGTATRPQGNMLVVVNGVTYPVLSATANTDSEGGAGWTVEISRPNPNLRSENLGLNGAVSDDAAVSFYLRSQVASSGHTMEYVGSGTNYNALPENGGIPVDANQIVESNYGKIWTAITDQNGKFKIGDFFEVDQRKGFINFSAGSYAFDVVTDSTPELGGQLDALNNKIVNLGTPTDSADAATKAYVDAAVVTELSSDTSPQLGGNLDVNGNEITSASNGNVVINPDGTGIIELGSNVGIGTTLPDGALQVVGNALIGASGSQENSTYQAEIRSGGNATLKIQAGASNTAYLGFGTTSNALTNNIQLDNSSGLFGINVNGSRRLAITSAGNVGIGTNNPGAPLEISNAGPRIRLRDSDGTDTYGEVSASTGAIFISHRNGAANGQIIFQGQGGGAVDEYGRFDTSGRLLVGTSSTLGPAGFSPLLQVQDTNNSHISLTRNIDSVAKSHLIFSKTRGSAASPSIVQNNDALGGILFCGHDGNGLGSIGAFIEVNVDGTPGASDMPGRLVFSTTASGASSPTERVRISSNGVLTVKNGAVAEIDTLTSAATVTPDFAASCNFTLTLDQNLTIANPSNLVAGQTGSIFLVQDATGSRTAAWGTYWDFIGGTAPTLTTTASAVDRVDYVVRSSTSIHAVATLNYS